MNSKPEFASIPGSSGVNVRSSSITSLIRVLHKLFDFGNEITSRGVQRTTVCARVSNCKYKTCNILLESNHRCFDYFAFFHSHVSHFKLLSSAVVDMHAEFHVMINNIFCKLEWNWKLCMRVEPFNNLERRENKVRINFFEHGLI